VSPVTNLKEAPNVDVRCPLFVVYMRRNAPSPKKLDKKGGVWYNGNGDGYSSKKNVKITKKRTVPYVPKRRTRGSVACVLR